MVDIPAPAAPETDAAVDPPITPATILPKLAYILYGEGYENHRQQFRAALNKFWRRTQAPPISRQAINNWFQKGGLPSRADATHFLQSYFGTIARDDLSDDQKKVHSQLATFFRQYDPDWIPGTPSSSVGLSKTRRVIISHAQSPEDIARLVRRLSGCYFLYHIRLVGDPDQPLAREFMQIFPQDRGRELRFIIWNQNLQSGAARFEGPVILVGDSLWFIGLSNTGERLRVMVFRDLRMDNLTYTLLRWGLLCSDIPIPGSPDPAACRVLLWKSSEVIPDTVTAANYARAMVRNYTKEMCEQEPLKTIMRFVSNGTSANSEEGSVVPLADYSPVADAILKVSQPSIDVYCEVIEERGIDPWLERRISERARALWEEDGRPEGKSVEHWRQAEAEIQAATRRKDPL